MTKNFVQKMPEGNTVTTVFPDGLLDISADGIGPAIVGFPFTKIMFFQQRMNEHESADVLREVVSIVQIPTAAILEFADGIRSTLAQNIESVDTTYSKARTLITGD